tara:strand:+ start:249 stop:668 length:420 start_codon:yes stop_codon:yes gene_type:complete
MTITPLKLIDLTFTEFEEMFKPVINHIGDNAGESHTFETYGAELEFVKTKIDENLVWTMGDGDMCMYISNGYHYVNRISYYVCSVPFDPEVEYQIIISTEEECTCYSEDEAVVESRGGEYGDPDCDKCEGYGLVTVYND